MSGGYPTAANHQGQRRTTLMLELMPLAAGVILLIFFVGLYLTLELDIWFGYVGMASGPVIAVAGWAFLVSGIGWIRAGHRAIGLLICFGRGFVSLGILAMVSPEGEPFVGMMSFAASMAIAAGSTLALAFVTKRRSSMS